MECHRVRAARPSLGRRFAESHGQDGYSGVYELMRGTRRVPGTEPSGGGGSVRSGPRPRPEA
ncbi:hypothetical protein GCM10022384_00340 [Streptomyces marokkonensis]|uniref:Uncharacterized protein n=1 Tax=Streptomyces marokkonensis TaxID=324855 RepID=A0ABP7NML6_9ACTN